MDVSVEQLLTVELYSVRHAAVADVPTVAGSADRLHHRFLSADALEHRVSAESVGQLLYPGHALITALGHDVGRAKLTRELLPRIVTAHRDNTLGSHLLGGEHTEEPDRAV